ncbi:hypothetical protein A2594_02535 [Candidatus Woesebacteria bacterium RIFOXYD1_FULL_41_28]|uniref:Uncharacterized protein n=3 Tax=Candidatus Woeseibacteriota TaxID=1752722 RepID=A0A0G0QT55_9BACT|nr:MAG: hypothetical protein UT76_C0042G0006 [Candidatus Woesebacteria bacterium GW2011_GWB1_40_12]OGM81184.1 MAG: hypothetical protein A2393_01455 [Candidatus Woesebacteria bacterium RIFOXYB1_FULL_41_13]OGM88903.1 MAG: hypothetical protein A2594_02535 [Candidatus Woesebacteria bacterium RIFOXYD1_FULL_41_28]
MRQKGFVPILIVIILALAGIGGAYYFGMMEGNSLPVTIQTPSPVATSTPNATPTSKISIPTPTVKPTPTPTATPVVRSFEEEEMSMRKTLAGFEMYIGAKNTAGALSFFTPAQTSSAKAKYESIRTKNLSFGLQSWQFVEDSNYKLAVETINGGYRVRVYECRTDGTCPVLFFELVRNDSAENHFSVDRYYTASYSYQNNLGEEIKYQGFGL